jgi:glucose-6-phosphate 1-epimerase
VIEFKKLENYFEYIEVKNASASAKIALQGAHIFEYKRTNEEAILWLSKESAFETGIAVRGGVPICWPSFGMNNPDLPQHGFARNSMFRFVDSKDINDKTTQITLKLNDSKESLIVWNYKFELEFKVTISDNLTMELTTTNLDKKPFEITQALHTYFSVSDISNVKIKGLDKKPYFDALTSKECLQNGDITFHKEFDSVYQEVNNELFLIDKDRTIKLENEGSSSVVVWNPWIEKCSKMSGMSSEAYKEFVCIESANAFGDFKIIHPNMKYTLKAIIF